MPQMDVSPQGGLLPPTLHLDAFPESDSELVSTPKKPLFLQNGDSDNELDFSQKSSASTSSQGFCSHVLNKGSQVTKSLDLEQVQSLHSGLDQGALFSARDSIPRSTTPVFMDQNPTNCLENEVTPVKPTQEVDPLTPTANLKVLFNAISPEIRKLEQQRRREDDEETADEFDVLEEPIQRVKKFRKKKMVKMEDVTDEEDEVDCGRGPEILPQQTVGRKEKSLGLLCQRFLQLYPDNPTENVEICLDEVAQQLSVERRRIYDIVNVLESVEIVSRKAKNKYRWHGRTHLVHTLLKLKKLAEANNYPAKLEALLEHEKQNSSKSKQKSKKQSTIPPSLFTEAENKEIEPLRKEKSLGIMSQKFLMLFLVSKTKMINLEFAAKILIGDPDVDKTATAKFKTKIRRLYDIANILTSLELVQKLHITQAKTRKPSFIFIGPNLEDYDLSKIPAVGGFERSNSKQSLLDPITNYDASKDLQSKNMKGPIRPATTNTKRAISRHSSFDQLCAVSEQLLYFESKSLPTSPTNINSNDAAPEKPKVVAQPVVTKLGRPPSTKRPVKPSAAVQEILKASGNGEISIISPGQPSTVIEIRKGYTAVRENGNGDGAQAQSESMYVQLPSANYQAPILVPTTAFQPGMQVLNTGVKRALENPQGNEPVVKRVKHDEPVVVRKKPSPVRTLHLSPEFSEPPSMSPNSLGLEFPSFPSPFLTPGVLPPTPTTQVKSELNTPTFKDNASNNFSFPIMDTPITPSLKVSAVNSPVMLLANGSIIVSGAKFGNREVSPLVSTVASTAFHITPTTTKPRMNSIQPSVKKIVNLMPVFSEGKKDPQGHNQQYQQQQPHAGFKFITHKPTTTTTAAATQKKSALILPINPTHGNKPRTPVSQTLEGGGGGRILTAHNSNNCTPSPCAVPVRPSAAATGAPCATLFHRYRDNANNAPPSHSVLVPNPNSAFDQFDAGVSSVGPVAARRLPL